MKTHLLIPIILFAGLISSCGDEEKEEFEFYTSAVVESVKLEKLSNNQTIEKPLKSIIVMHHLPQNIEARGWQSFEDIANGFIIGSDEIAYPYTHRGNPSDGRFLAVDIEPGNYAVVVIPTDYLVWTYSTFRLPANETTNIKKVFTSTSGAGYVPW